MDPKDCWDGVMVDGEGVRHSVPTTEDLPVQWGRWTQNDRGGSEPDSRQSSFLEKGTF